MFEKEKLEDDSFSGSGFLAVAKFSCSGEEDEEKNKKEKIPSSQ